MEINVSREFVSFNFFIIYIAFTIYEVSCCKKGNFFDFMPTIYVLESRFSYSVHKRHLNKPII